MVCAMNEVQCCTSRGIALCITAQLTPASRRTYSTSMYELMRYAVHTVRARVCNETRTIAITLPCSRRSKEVHRRNCDDPEQRGQRSVADQHHPRCPSAAALPCQATGGIWTRAALRGASHRAGASSTADVITRRAAREHFRPAAPAAVGGPGAGWSMCHSDLRPSIASLAWMAHYDDYECKYVREDVPG